jgi:hypothetical protein
VKRGIVLFKEHYSMFYIWMQGAHSSEPVMFGFDPGHAEDRSSEPLQIVT